MADDTQQPSESPRSLRPKIRVNSDKIAPLDGAAFEEAIPQSKFSQWRARREESARVASELPQGLSLHSEGTDSALQQPQRVGFSIARLKKWGIGVGSVLVLALLFIGVVFYSPLLAIRTVTVEGTSLLQQSAVQDRLGVLEGKPLTRVSESEVAQLVGNSDKIREITVEARPPHELVVTIHERVPVAVVEDGDSTVLVDAEGHQLGEAGSPEDASLPLVEGGIEILDSVEFRTIASVLEALPSDLLSQVSKAQADSASTISLTMSDGTDVVWGTAEESELKAKVLIQLRSSLGESGSVSSYDVSSPLVPTTK